MRNGKEALEDMYKWIRANNLAFGVVADDYAIIAKELEYYRVIKKYCEEETNTIRLGNKIKSLLTQVGELEN